MNQRQSHVSELACHALSETGTTFVITFSYPAQPESLSATSNVLQVEMTVQITACMYSSNTSPAESASPLTPAVALILPKDSEMGTESRSPMMESYSSTAVRQALMAKDAKVLNISNATGTVPNKKRSAGRMPEGTGFSLTRMVVVQPVLPVRLANFAVFAKGIPQINGPATILPPLNSRQELTQQCSEMRVRWDNGIFVPSQCP